MSPERSKYERLLAEWRTAETRAEALRQFQANGGAYRLRITLDGEEAVPTSILDDLLRHDGYRSLLITAIRRAEAIAQDAKQAFLSEAAGDAIGIDAARAGGAA